MYVTPKQASQHFKVQRETLRRWAETNKIYYDVFSDQELRNILLLDHDDDKNWFTNHHGEKIKYVDFIEAFNCVRVINRKRIFFYVCQISGLHFEISKYLASEYF